MRSLNVARLLLVGCIALPAFASPWQPPNGQTEIEIWPKAAPGGQVVNGPEKTEPGKSPVAGKPWTAITNVTRPTITLFYPTVENTGVTLVVFPGGGYRVLAIDLEGTEVCDWAVAKGITCVLLKYRVPYGTADHRSGPCPQASAALQDAQRTMGLLRLNAKKWKINPRKIGVVGFSAGGHLAAAISTNYKKRVYSLVDAADTESCRPDYAIPVYPGHMAKNYKVKLGLNPSLPVTSETPPTLLIHAKDDPVDPVGYSLLYSAELKRKKVPVEMHLFEDGGHAFGLRPTKFPITNWPSIAEAWLVKIGMINRGSSRLRVECAELEEC